MTELGSPQGSSSSLQILEELLAYWSTRGKRRNFGCFYSGWRKIWGGISSILARKGGVLGLEYLKSSKIFRFFGGFLKEKSIISPQKPRFYMNL